MYKVSEILIFYSAVLPNSSILSLSKQIYCKIAKDSEMTKSSFLSNGRFTRLEMSFTDSYTFP